MAQDKLMPLALEMTQKLKQRQERELAKHRLMGIRAEELSERLHEFEIEKGFTPNRDQP
jgi:hypothetical protein